MKINNKNAMAFKKYDYDILSKIYEEGTKQFMLIPDSLSEEEMAFVMSAGHALDLVSACQPDEENLNESILDFTLETQQNIGRSVIFLMIKDIKENVSERITRDKLSKKISSYIMFEMWNFMNDPKVLCKYNIRFELSLGFDFATGTKSVKQQDIAIYSKKNNNRVARFDALKIGKKFVEKGIDFLDRKGCQVGADMEYLFELIKEELNQLDI